MEAENFSPGKVEAGGEDKALGRDCTQHQLIKLAGEMEEEREQEKEKDKGKMMKRNGTRMGPSMLVKEMIYVNLLSPSIPSTFQAPSINLSNWQEKRKRKGEKKKRSTSSFK